MKNLLILIFLFTLLQVKGQIYLREDKPRLTIICSNDSLKNDSLFKQIPNFTSYQELLILLDSGEVTVDMKIFKNARQATFIGGGCFNIFYSGNNGLPKLRKMEVRAKLKKLDFGSGLLNLDSLIMLRTGLYEIPKTIGKCTNLRFINLSVSNINSFSSELQELKKLKVLVITNCQISKLPDQLTKNTALQSLNFGFNRITEFPKVLFKLPNLEVVSLMANNIPDIPYKKLKRKDIEFYY
jgi:hypothetical protein